MKNSETVCGGVYMKRIAIILAAGMGTRLRPETEKVPKCLVKVDNKPILEYQLEMLETSGFSKVIVVGGYLVEELRDYILNSKFSDMVELLVNKEYGSTNNMYSLGMAFDNVWNEDWNTVYVLNGDVVFEKSFLENASGESSGVFVDKTVYIEESMKVILGEDGYISDISKKIGEDSYYAVSVDMYRFQREEAKIFYKRIKEIINSGRVNQWTEVALSELFREGLLKMVPVDISGYIWWEIDNHEDKLRALSRLKLLR